MPVLRVPFFLDIAPVFGKCAGHVPFASLILLPTLLCSALCPWRPSYMESIDHFLCPLAFGLSLSNGSSRRRLKRRRRRETFILAVLSGGIIADWLHPWVKSRAPFRPSALHLTVLWEVKTHPVVANHIGYCTTVCFTFPKPYLYLWRYSVQIWVCIPFLTRF